MTETGTATINETEPEQRTLSEGIHWGTGRRKTSVARVRLIVPGEGKIEINGREFEDFFPIERHRQTAALPLRTGDVIDKVDVKAKVDGGGPTGQAGAIRLGIGRALVKACPELEETLREAGHLTRDSRMKERKHYGFRGARRGTQFSKR